MPTSLVHGSLLQLWVCSIIPSHSRPPFLGGGAEHVLFLCLTPPPQRASHSDHFVHSDQRPSTAWESHFISSLCNHKTDVFEAVTTWTCPRETRSTIKLRTNTVTSRHSFPQNLPLSEQRTQTTGNTARTPCRPGGHNAVYCMKRAVTVEK